MGEIFRLAGLKTEDVASKSFNAWIERRRTIPSTQKFSSVIRAISDIAQIKPIKKKASDPKAEAFCIFRPGAD